MLFYLYLRAGYNKAIENGTTMYERGKVMNVMIIPIFICLFSFLAYKKWSPILLGPAMALLLVICCRLPVLDTMLGPYLESSASFVKSNF